MPLPLRCRRYGAVLTLAVALPGAAACSGASGSPLGATTASTASTASGSPTPSVTPPSVRVDGKAHRLSYRSPVRLVARHGTFTSVTVRRKGGDVLHGKVSADGRSWRSAEPPLPRARYAAKATVKDTAGTEHTTRLRLRARTVRPDHRLTFTVAPLSGATVGIGEPLVVRFTTPVTRERAVERAMHVDATTPSGHQVAGAWHWFSGQEVHWRPKHFWTPGTDVRLTMALRGVQASASRWGRKAYAQKFTIGSSSVLKVDARTHMMKVYRDGKHIATWPTGTGRPNYPTRNGTYIVLEKLATHRMTSCSAGISCNKKSPSYYDTVVHDAVRISSSGTFVHAAPWDGVMGHANTSHGCIHLSVANAHTYYDGAKAGDVVIVRGSNQGPDDRVTALDPGLVDWNLSWAQWKAGSALH